LSLTPKEVKDQLVTAIDQAIEKGEWTGSLFLKNILKQLEELRGYVIQELSEDTSAKTISQKRQEAPQEREGYERVYISLYQSESNRLDRWVATIKMLTGYGISRPVYRSEEEVQHMIREKQSKSDAYVTAWVKQADILPSYSGTPLKDRWGYELVALKEGSVKPENIIMFVHDGKQYYLTDQGLMLAGE